MNLKKTALAVLLTLVAVELLLRFVHPIDYRRPPERVREDAWRELVHRRSAIPGLAYELAPDRQASAYGAVVRTNSHGMRDREPLPQRQDSLDRIVVLGDSFTFGMGVVADAVWPAVLEELLNRTGRKRRCDVLNFGVGGYATQDEALVLQHKGMAWDPQLVILGYALNDPETAPLQRLHAYFVRTQWWQHFNILRLVADVKWKWDIRRLGGGDYIRYLHAESQPRWRSVLSAFAVIEQETSARGVPVLLVIFPWCLESTWDAYPYLQVHRQVAAAARENGFAVIDLYDRYCRHPPLSVRAAPGDPHPNELGHRLCAEAVYDWIRNHEELCE